MRCQINKTLEALTDHVVSSYKLYANTCNFLFNLVNKESVPVQVVFFL